MEQLFDLYDNGADHKQLSYLCILLVLILHALLLLLLFTFTHLIVPPEHPIPSFDTIVDVTGPAAPAGAAPLPAGIQETGSTLDDYEQATATEESVAPAAGSTETAEPITAAVPSIAVPATSVPDVIDQAAVEPVTTPALSPSAPRPPGQPRTYRIRRAQYHTTGTLNGTTFAQMGQQIQSHINQSVETQAEEKQTNRLKYHSYVNSLHQFLYGNFNPRNEAIYLEYSVYMPIDVDIEIDSRGRCTTVMVSNSTGDSALDAFIIHHLKKAGPFPPLPTHFGVRSWHFPLRLMVNCPRGKGVPKITPH